MMLHPQARVTDLDPDGWARLSELMARASELAPAALYVLHEGGRVIGVHQTRGAPPECVPAVLNPQALAVQLRARTGVDRVVVIDRTGLGDILHGATARIDPTLTTPELRGAMEAAFWSSPAVATDPAPPREPWSAIRRGLAELAPRLVAVLVLRDEASVLGMQLTMTHGLITDLTCVTIGPDTAESIARLDVQPDCWAEVPWSAVERVLAAPDRLGALADVLEPAAVGAHELVGLLREAGRP